MEGDEGLEPIPKWQAFYDNLLVLFLLGFVIFVGSYTVWGVVESLNVPQWQPK